MLGSSRVVRVAVVGVVIAALGLPSVASSAHAGPAPAPAGMHVEGNQILDAAGRPVLLRGVNNYGGLATSVTTYHLEDADFDRIKSWNANTVRIALSTRFWVEDLCQAQNGNRAIYQAKVDAIVDRITSRGMVADLALFNTTNGEACGSTAFIQPKMADQYAIGFWQEVAARYKDNPLVMFELFNEPHGISDEQWLNGGTLTSNGVTWQAPGMQQLYDVVRSTGATNLVLVDGAIYASDIQVALRRPLTGTNIVYAAHAYCEQYEGSVEVRPECASGALSPTLAQRMDPVIARHPVLFTEFGKRDGTDYAGVYNAAVIAFAASRNIGWTAYQWSIRRDDYGLLSDWTGTPSLAGICVKLALLGATPSTGWRSSSPSRDEAVRRLELG